MWSLETLAQLNAKHAELGRDNKPVDHREVYAACGIRLLGDTQKPSVRETPWHIRPWKTKIVRSSLIQSDPIVYAFGPPRLEIRPGQRTQPLIPQDQIDRQVEPIAAVVPMTPEEIRQNNDAIFERLNDPAVAAEASDAVNRWTRNKVRAHMGLPPLPMTDVEELSAKLTAMGIAHRVVDPNAPRPDPPKEMTRDDHKAYLLEIADKNPFMSFEDIAKYLCRRQAWVAELIVEARRERDERLGDITL